MTSHRHLFSKALPSFLDRADIDPAGIAQPDGLPRGVTPIEGTNGNDSITGTAHNDYIEGLDGNDTIDGGAGADTMVGGKGDDTYYVDNADDLIQEKFGGNDSVFSSVSYQLPGGVENITLTGTASINATGNLANNTIIGNSGDNVLDGRGGIDHIDGGDGSDVYLVSAGSQHQAAEFADSGTTGLDEVRFSGSDKLVLFAGDTGIERVVIGTGSGVSADTSGTAAATVDASLAPNALVMMGNDGNDTITGTAFSDFILGAGGNDKLLGGAGDDTLIGGGGIDSLTGGAGNDVFWMEFTPSAQNFLTITDFTSGQDKIYFTPPSAVGALTPTAITSNQFYAAANATAAHDADDRFVLNTTTGTLYYDDDGIGGHAAVKIAVIGTHATLVFSDIDILS